MLIFHFLVPYCTDTVGVKLPGLKKSTLVSRLIIHFSVDVTILFEFVFVFVFALIIIFVFVSVIVEIWISVVRGWLSTFLFCICLRVNILICVIILIHICINWCLRSGLVWSGADYPLFCCSRITPLHSHWSSRLVCYTLKPHFTRSILLQFKTTFSHNILLAFDTQDLFTL